MCILPYQVMQDLFNCFFVEDFIIEINSYPNLHSQTFQAIEKNLGRMFSSFMGITTCSNFLLTPPCQRSSLDLIHTGRYDSAQDNWLTQALHSSNVKP